MDILETIRQRRAVRDYKPDPVQRSTLRELVEAANWAPSIENGRPWRFVVVTNRTLLDRILRPDAHIVAPVVIGYLRGLLRAVPRHSPHITWIDEENILADEGTRSEPAPATGLYGPLVHP